MAKFPRRNFSADATTQFFDALIGSQPPMRRDDDTGQIVWEYGKAFRVILKRDYPPDASIQTLDDPLDAETTHVFYTALGYLVLHRLIEVGD